METPREQRAAEIQDSIRQVLFRDWDPIGVNSNPNLVDEYDSYAPQIVSMVESGCSSDALVAHLEHLSVHTIGVGSNVRASMKFAAEIIRTLQSPGT